MQDKENSAKEWQDAQGCRLKICGYNAGYYGEAVPWVRLRSTEDKFDMLSLATLNEIRAHLDLLAREVFGEKVLTVADVLARIQADIAEQEAFRAGEGRSDEGIDESWVKSETLDTIARFIKAGAK